LKEDFVEEELMEATIPNPGASLSLPPRPARRR